VNPDEQEPGANSSPSDDPVWRADALARSSHTRLHDEMRPPLEDHDPERAARICAEISRAALSDFAPALILLPSDLRRRAQALTAFTVTLFDFAHQPGIEGERFAAINRWEFELENALSGTPAGQPVSVRMAAEEAQRRWSRTALESLVSIARRRITRPTPSTADLLGQEFRSIGAALVEGILGDPCSEPIAELAGACLRVGALVNLYEADRQGRVYLPPVESQAHDGSETGKTNQLFERVAAEIGRLHIHLDAGMRTISTLPPEIRPAGRYLVRAANLLLDRVARRGADASLDCPRIGIGRRLALIARALLGI